jgi:hypothetical protein
MALMLPIPLISFGAGGENRTRKGTRPGGF